MSREVYFVCATPGSSGNLLGSLLRSLIDQGQDITLLNSHTFANPVPDILTADFFYDNIELPQDGKFIINVPFRPDYDKLNARFPGCKIIVLTHLVQDIHKIAANLFTAFFLEAYEAGAETYFRAILQSHSHLFSNINATPTELTPKEENIFVKILGYQKLLDGFYSLTIPTDPNVLEIPFRTMIYDSATTKQALSSFTNRSFTTLIDQYYKGASDTLIARYHTHRVAYLR